MEPDRRGPPVAQEAPPFGMFLRAPTGPAIHCSEPSRAGCEKYSAASTDIRRRSIPPDEQHHREPTLWIKRGRPCGLLKTFPQACEHSSVREVA